MEKINEDLEEIAKDFQELSEKRHDISYFQQMPFEMQTQEIIQFYNKTPYDPSDTQKLHSFLRTHFDSFLQIQLTDKEVASLVSNTKMQTFEKPQILMKMHEDVRSTKIVLKGKIHRLSFCAGNNDFKVDPNEQFELVQPELKKLKSRLHDVHHVKNIINHILHRVKDNVLYKKLLKIKEAKFINGIDSHVVELMNLLHVFYNYTYLGYYETKDIFDFVNPKLTFDCSQLLIAEPPVQWMKIDLHKMHSLLPKIEQFVVRYSKTMRKLPIFQEFHDKDFNYIHQYITKKVGIAGETIAHQDRSIDYVYTIKSGLVNIINHGKTVVQIGEGQMFGEQIIHKKSVNQYEYTCQKRSEFYQIDIQSIMNTLRIETIKQKLQKALKNNTKTVQDFEERESGPTTLAAVIALQKKKKAAYVPKEQSQQCTIQQAVKTLDFKSQQALKNYNLIYKENYQFQGYTEVMQINDYIEKRKIDRQEEYQEYKKEQNYKHFGTYKLIDRNSCAQESSVQSTQKSRFHITNYSMSKLSEKFKVSEYKPMLKPLVDGNHKSFQTVFYPRKTKFQNLSTDLERQKKMSISQDEMKDIKPGGTATQFKGKKKLLKALVVNPNHTSTQFTKTLY